MDIPLAMKSKPGGTIAICHYEPGQILGNPAAQDAWDRIFDVWAAKLLVGGRFAERAIRHGDTALETVPFPSVDWEAGEKRMYINVGTDGIGALSMSKLVPGEPSRVGDNVVIETVESDEDWVGKKYLAWMKGMVASILPAIPEEDIPELVGGEGSGWEGGDCQDCLAICFVQLLATKL